MPADPQPPTNGDTKSLLLWIAGRWGGGAVFGVIAMIGLGIVYQDMRADRARELADRARETEINATTAEILKRMETRLEAIERRLSDSN